MGPDQIDRAIKRSAMDLAPGPSRPQCPRLEGKEKESLVSSLIKAKNVPINFDSVAVFNYPAFDECFDHMLINFYYTNNTDPTTTIKAYRVYKSGDISDA
jgi:hypothetical protein